MFFFNIITPRNIFKYSYIIFINDKKLNILRFGDIPINILTFGQMISAKETDRDCRGLNGP